MTASGIHMRHTLSVREGAPTRIRIRVAACLLSLTITAPSSHANLVSNLTTHATYSTIQAAINGAGVNHILMVSTGTYTEAGITNGGKSLTIRGVAASNTIIRPAGSDRVFLIAGGSSTLEKMTILWGQTTGDGGGVCCQSGVVTLKNCILSGNSAATNGGGAFNANLQDCILTNNSAAYGGGAYGGSLSNCQLTANGATYGGGAYSSRLDRCILTSNRATCGGAASGCVLTNCVLNANTAYTSDLEIWPCIGGAAYSCSLYTCALTNNSARDTGGGVYASTLEDCVLVSNSVTCAYWARYRSEDSIGGGAYKSILNNCTLRGNSVSGWGGGVAVSILSNCTLICNAVLQDGGGAYASTLNNCTLSNNTASSGGGASGSTLSNCTLTANSASSGGGAGGCTLTNCTLIGNSASIDGGGAKGSSLTDCTLTANTAGNGGGTSGGALTNCVLMGNWATGNGGGSCGDGLNNCTLIGNSANSGGGASGTPYYDLVRSDSFLINCTLSSNVATSGGGVYGSTLTNCTLSGNHASEYGGGARAGTLNNCTLTGNAANYGGGAWGGINNAQCTLNNCTLTGNRANEYGGGAYDATLNNCIAWYNQAPVGQNYWTIGNGVLRYCCTEPDPGGTGNIAADPNLVSASHVGAGSPCIGAGSTNYALGTDTDGEAWNVPPSIGCDEYWSGALTGDLSVAIQADYTNVAVEFELDLAALIQGRTTGSVWWFGDGTVLSNRPCVAHAWDNTGTYAVVLAAYNESHQAGVMATVRVTVVEQPVHYVDARGLSPAAAYTSWRTAATNIQDAVDAATLPGALVLVTNGVYAAGGRVLQGSLTNRLVINKPVTVRSVNGPETTAIKGCGPQGSSSAVRCVYLGTHAVLDGFTLTNGATMTSELDSERSGGGVRCGPGARLTNCVISGSSAVYGGGAYGGTLNRCTLLGNSANLGGATCGGMLNHCTLVGNYASASGGGAWGSELHGADVRANSAVQEGGGAFTSAVDNCTLTANTAGSGGGASGGMLRNCVLTSNEAIANGSGGGGTLGVTLKNCMLTGNTAVLGGGASGGTLNNCTLAGNTAYYGGGANGGVLNNCIIYYNNGSVGQNHWNAVLRYCCTVPALPDAGNIAADPVFSSAWHLGDGSPCIGAGSAEYAVDSDIDGEAWGAPPSIGCDEYHLGVLTGALNVAIVTQCSNVTVGCELDFTASIEGRATASSWFFGDGVVVSNRPCISHSWTATGTYAVVLGAYNETHLGGVMATVMVTVVRQPVHYVDAGNVSPEPPFSSWETAATNIQDAIDAATVAGALVLVTNGEYASGGRVFEAGLTNRVLINKPLTVRSANGPALTAIKGSRPQGSDAVRCVYMGARAVLDGFTLTNGATLTSGSLSQTGGGGVRGELTSLVVNSVIAGNSAACGGGGFNCTFTNCTLTANSADTGGGMAFSTLSGCTLTANSAGSGGGAYYGTLNDCTLMANSASFGGGAHGASLGNCAVTANSASYGGGAYYGTLNNCTLMANSANRGGGVCRASLNNCLLTGNNAGVGNGGGAYSANLTNCTLVGNSAYFGGGAYYGSLVNCIVYYNLASYSPSADASGSFLRYCCSPYLSQIGGSTAEPQFVDLTNGNYRLQATSPCINKGTNGAWMAGAIDLDDKPRIIYGRVDMGAYEWLGSAGSDSDADGLNDAAEADWVTDPFAADTDHDGLRDGDEVTAGTSPTNGASRLMVNGCASGNDGGFVIWWDSVLRRSYTVAARAAHSSAWDSVYLTEGDGLPKSYTNPAADPGPRFFRLSVTTNAPPVTP